MSGYQPGGDREAPNVLPFGGSNIVGAYIGRSATPIYSATQHEPVAYVQRLPEPWQAMTPAISGPARFIGPPSTVEILSPLPLIDLRGMSGTGIFWRCLTLGLLCGAVLAVVTFSAVITR